MSFPVDTDPEPELNELQQRSSDEPVDTRMVCVIDEIRDPTRTQSLPARGSVMHSVTIPGTVVTVFGRDLRRARAVIWPLAQSPAVQLYVGTRADVVIAGTAAIIDTNAQPLELKNDQPLFARAVSSSSTIVLSYLLEYWAD